MLLLLGDCLNIAFLDLVEHQLGKGAIRVQRFLEMVGRHTIGSIVICSCGSRYLQFGLRGGRRGSLLAHLGVDYETLIAEVVAIRVARLAAAVFFSEAA